MIYALLASPLAIPLIFYITMRRIVPTRWPLHFLAAGLGGAAAGAFVASAAAAMQSVLSPLEAFARGAGIGLIAGLTVAGAAAAAAWLWQAVFASRSV